MDTLAPNMPFQTEMHERVARFDWSKTELGPRADWPQSLVTIVDTVLCHGFPMIALLGPRLIQIYNDAYGVVMDAKHPAGLGQPTEVCWPEVWHINGPIYERVLQGEIVTYEDGLYPLARSGELRDAWFTLTYSPIRDDNGTICGVLVTMIETTARMLAERERDLAMAGIREAEQRQRFMLELGDRLRPLSHVDDLREMSTSIIAERFDARDIEFDMDRELLGADAVAKLRAGERFVDWNDGICLALAPADADCAVLHLRRNGEGGWSATDLSLLKTAAERCWAAMEKARADQALQASLDYQKLLLGELQHRVRNNLTIIKVIAKRSGAGARTVEEYKDTFLGRLAAFVRVQSAVTHDPEKGLNLRELLRDELSAFAQGSRISYEGDNFTMSSRAAERFALATHELATNAAKYGALGKSGGRLDIKWQIDGEDFIFLWEESGLTDITVPQRRGFGSNIVESALRHDLGATTHFEYRPIGLRCEIVVPLENLR